MAFEDSLVAALARWDTSHGRARGKTERFLVVCSTGCADTGSTAFPVAAEC